MFTKSSRDLYVIGILLLAFSILGFIGFFGFSFESVVHGNADGSDILQIDGDFIQRVPFIANDIVYNPQDQMLYASRPSSIGSGGNSIARINPLNGAVVSSTFIGSEPGKLAISSNSQTIYAVLNGAFGIRRYDVATQMPGIQFSIGNDNGNPYTANDIAIAPGSQDILAVVRYKPGTSPPGGGVAIFNNGVQLPSTGPGHIAGADYLAFSNIPSTLYGGGDYYGLRTMIVDNNGVTVLPNSSTFGVGRIKFDNGLLYSSTGQVVDPQSLSLLGTFSVGFSNAFVPDSSVGRAFYAVRDSGTNSITIKAFDLATYIAVGNLIIPNATGEPVALVRYGTNGLALKTSDNLLFLIQTSLIPTGNPLPTPTSTPTPTTTPTPPSVPTYTRQISLPAKDILYNPSTEKIYASVRSSDNIRGNSITTIDPLTGVIENSVFVGSEPGKMDLADDLNTVYVGIDGAGAVRRFNTSTQTAGSQFSFGVGNNGPIQPLDIDIMPGNASTVAVTGYSYGARIYDDGVQRFQTGTSGPVVFGSAATVYVGNSPITRYNVVPIGLSYSGIIPSAGNGYTKIANGLIYTTNGRVIDTTNGSIKGTFSGLGYTSSTMTIDLPNNRAFFLANSQNSGSVYSIRVFELDTFLPLGSIPVSDTFPDTATSLTRWGTNGLAFRSDSGKINLIQSSLVSSTGIVPIPTPTITPTPTQSPIYAPTFVRQLNLPANEVVYSPATQSLYASIPSFAGVGRGNTITKINPVSGSIDSSTFIGSEPSKLAISSDGQTLYTKLDGAGNAIRKFDILLQTPGLQFTPDSNFQLIEDIEVMPGNPNTLAIGARYNGVAIYDNGIKRPTTSTGSLYSVNSLEFADSSTLYGYESESSGFGLARFTVTPNGVTGVNLGGNMISGYSVNIRYANGLIFSTSGRVVNPVTPNVIGSFAGGGSAMAVDSVSGRVFYVSNNMLTAYDSNTFLKIGSAFLPSFTGTPTSLVRWGQNGLAFRTTNSNSNSNDSQIYIIQSSLVSPTAILPVGIQFSGNSFYTYENAQSGSVVVSRSGDLSAVSTIDYATLDGTAKAGSDYTAQAGTVTFAPGESSKVVGIQILEDTIYEGAESFSVILTNPTGINVSLTYPSSAAITINDNDSQPTILPSNTSVTEPTLGATSLALFPINLTNPSFQTITVNYSTSNGTAIAGSDYVATNGTLTIAPFETVKTVSVSVLGDSNVAEANEVFYLNFSGAVNGRLNSSQVNATIVNYNPQTARHAAFDFDGDGRADSSVFRQSSGIWYLNQSQSGFNASQFGIATDKLVPADYDGDGKTDIAVYRDGIWYQSKSATGFSSSQFGFASDVPVPADYDGDGFADLAVWRSSNQVWYIWNSSSGVVSSTQFGIATDKPIPADYDGDGKTDIAVYRNGIWYVLGSTIGFTQAQFGITSDKLVPADYDGDRKADFAVFRDGIWYILLSTTGLARTEQFGLPTDVPMTGDYDGDSKADVAVFRDGVWYSLRSTSGFVATQFGFASDTSIPSVYVR